MVALTFYDLNFNLLLDLLCIFSTNKIHLIPFETNVSNLGSKCSFLGFSGDRWTSGTVFHPFSQAQPPEGWFSGLRLMSLFNKPHRGQHIGNVVQPSYFSSHD
uniref:Uncharacterized protein n=1 Tax=Opuntia streptacantha TaxID=393608 RepID=A0A7C9ENN6_OPUST